MKKVLSGILICGSLLGMFNSITKEVSASEMFNSELEFKPELVISDENQEPIYVSEDGSIIIYCEEMLGMIDKIEPINPTINVEDFFNDRNRLWGNSLFRPLFSENFVINRGQSRPISANSTLDTLFSRNVSGMNRIDVQITNRRNATQPIRVYRAYAVGWSHVATLNFLPNVTSGTAFNTGGTGQRFHFGIRPPANFSGNIFHL